jgi:hypothetical protein
MAGFRPPWLAAVAGGWFNDDSERFLMRDASEYTRRLQGCDSPTDTAVRAQFRLRLAAMHEDLFRHYLQGIELRALFYACCNQYPANTGV